MAYGGRVMGVEFICDYCGKRETGTVNNMGRWFKPNLWYQRTDKETGKTSVACSRKCAEVLGGIIAPW